MRNALIGLLFGMSFAVAQPAAAAVSIAFSSGPVSIGVNVPVYPRLVAVPGVPVYYAPTVTGNYFFYDGLYWVFQDGNWYASDWYNGPWRMVAPDAVPLYLLRVPVRYYHRPPEWFHGWVGSAPPHWGEHWGHAWEEHHAGWDHWDHAHTPHRAPLPTYQKHYAGDRYPHEEERHVVRESNYHYQPHENVAREHYQEQRVAHESSAPRGSRPAAEVNQGHEKSSGNHGEHHDRSNDHGSGG